METGQYDIAITGDSSKFRSELNKATNAAKNSGKQVADAFEKAQQKVIGFGKNLAGATLGALGFSLAANTIVRAFESVIKAAIDQERSLAQLNSTLEVTGHAAGFTAEQLEKMGAEIQSRTVFDDDEIRKATTALLRFRDVSGDTFRQILKLAPDLATAVGGNLTEAMTTLARIAEGDERAMRSLKDQGVFLSEANKDLARAFKESGDTAGAAKIVFDELSQSIGGKSESDNTGTYGSVKRLERAWNDLKKSMGQHLLLPGQADKLTEFLERMHRKFAEVDRDRGIWQNLLDDLRKTGEILGLLDESFAFPDVSPESRALRRAEERTAALGKTIAEQKQQRDKEYTDFKEHLQRMANLASGAGTAMLQEQKTLLDIRQDQLAFAYSRGETSAENYYRALRNMSKANLDALLNDLNRQIQAQAAIITAKIPGTDKPAFSNAEREAAEKRGTELFNQATAAKAAAFRQNEQNLRQEQLDVEKLNDAYQELNAQLAEMVGNTAEAARIRDTVRTRGQRAAFGAEGMTSAVAAIDRINKQKEAQAALNDQQQRYSLLTESLDIAQQRIALRQQAGALPDLDALRERSELNAKMVPILKAQADAFEEAAKGLEGLAGEEARSKVARMRLEIETLATQTNLVGDKFRQIFEDNFADAFASFIDGTKSAKDAFKDFSKSVVSDITKMASRYISQALFGQLLGGLFGGPGAGAGGAGLLGSLLSSLFGGPGSSPNAGTLVPTEVPNAFYASGTDYARGGLAMVGERGPEVLYVPRGAQVIPMDQWKHRAGMVNNTTINVLPGATLRSADQAAGSVMRSMQRALRNR